MGFFSLKVFVILLGIMTVLGFATGVLHLNRDNVKCLHGKSWTFDEQWRTLVAFGELEIRLKPVNFDCDPDFKYNPKEYKNNNGILERIHEEVRTINQ